MNIKPLIFTRFLLPLSALACEKPKVTGYDDVGCLHNGLAKVEQNGKHRFVDKTGELIVPVQYDWVWYFSEDLASVKQNDTWGFVDKTGEVVIPYRYDDVRGFENGMAKVSLNGEIIFGEPFYIDKTGKRID
ncbi:hypothetical protein AAX05_03740 [Moraxella bovoculi]|uniref:WG repeat-containing protein n=1 Tax=Moraxella bovoculi TaxID=386891 RepID=A0AAC8PX22_9GAMM|nr:WG repeat-containing protein [Moraxella bovoculi]AKG08037.1 hypothetical protein AAX06_07565 [Moraxella bovoculi]AKG09426.1 hypothetical protein AAX05_03740 [Moraxella bovoculi]AKG11243.1 hypothetical protein AAX07_03715 [Moraxella bovoculi]AKG13251.1 hypothetical protein AAX11_03485 [Moraxella bovoculi]